MIKRLRVSLRDMEQTQRSGAKVSIVDNYSQKLVNSGFKGEQLQKIIVNGVKGYESKLRRCVDQGTSCIAPLPGQE